MIWSSRPIAPAERAALSAKLAPSQRRSSLISSMAYYGAFLVVIPFVGGGFLGTMLIAAGVENDPAYLVGFLLAVPASALLYWRHRHGERRELADLSGAREAIGRLDTLPTLTVSVKRIWSIASEPDWPAYLLQDADLSYVLLSTAELAFAEPEFARDQLAITASPPGRRHILALTWSGSPLALEPAELPMLEADWPGDGEVTILRPENLPHRWRSAADAA